MWIIGAALVALVAWHEFEQHKHSKHRRAVPDEPTRVRIVDDERVPERHRAQPAPPQPLEYATEPRVAPAEAPRAPPPRVETLYRCKSYGGSLFWSKTVCHQLRATIDRIATVPGALSFEQQVDIARGEAAAAAALTQPPPPAPVARHRGEPSARSAECAALDEQVRQIDAAARQPQPAYVQDSLKDQRMRARSRQSQLRC